MAKTNYDFAKARAFFEDRIAFTTGTHELDVLISGDTDSATYQVVDVRFPDDYAQGHVPGAVNLPMPKWDNRRFLEEQLDKDATLYLYCYTPTCHLAAQAGVKLTAAGYRVIEVEGGWEDWAQRGYAVEKSEQVKSA